MSSIGIVDLGLIKVGDEAWESEMLENGTSTFRFLNHPPVFHDGVYYCLDYKSRCFRIFDPTRDDECRWVHCGGDDDDEEKIYESYIAEVEGDIRGVFVTNDDDVKVRKWDFVRFCWRKLESLGGKCLYVSTSGSFAETCAISEMASKIYFDRFHGKSGVMYSLSSGMYHSVEGNYGSRDAYGQSHVDFGAWIKPTLDKM